MEVNVRRIGQQIRNFERALSSYPNKEPFSRFLTQFFKDNKQMGSSDRRMTSRLCYNFFRLGKAASQLSVTDRVVLAEFLCETESTVVSYYKPDWTSRLGDSVSDKIDFLVSQDLINRSDLFPLQQHLSAPIDTELFLQSQLIQPDLFIRLKRGSEAKVKHILTEAGVAFENVRPQTLALRNGTNLQQLKGLSGLYEVQDLSSQKTIDLIEAKDGESWWDACAASGGKALLFLDKYPSVKLLVSDIRMSILRNLDERFDLAGIKNYRKKVIDLTHDPLTILNKELFDGIILDAPCSGSGTWGRTPEMISQFKESTIANFSVLQRQIAKNVLRHLKTGKTLLYITCSVFKEENEDVVNFICEHLGCELEEMVTLKGYEQQADTMFAARLRKK
ncbi:MULTISPECIES: RsmB/NOP family class I SAM-dependent RNA methyltransferase [unclassified Sphingobacterium]|uniref:RsmB/NOP family class I SAM-dependent RNA methyltransferase n=1 Tax=unclassified Sphingobacterium TaxID=2609468 RepID=UPI0025E34FC4|nr:MULTISPECIES: RsmB/NOP family class I SAM-dependent RNA methyltransferase [unclassified Sphingobacterium]